jgi:catechol 2,3-dioxygenase
VDGSVGRGPAFRYRGPGGHLHEIFWEIERSTAPAGREPRVPNQPQRAPRRIAPRQLDHVTVTTNDPFGDSEWYRDHLGYRFMEFIKDDDGNVFFSTVTTNEKNHDLGLVLDRSGIGGRLHHVAYWVEEPNDLQRCAALLLDAGVPLEWGPGKHGIGEQYFLYFREPGGIRMEFNSGGYRNYIADWEPVQWRVDEGPDDFYGTNTRAPDSRDAFPPAGPEHAAAVAVEGVR